MTASDPAVLIGRDDELRSCFELLDRAATEGGALLLRGQAGTGKTALLNAVARRADELGWHTLKTSAVEAETAIPFAGLQPLLLPVVDAVAELPGQLGAAMLSALGLATAEIPSPEVVALGALSLLSGLATAERPIVLIVDDVHWLDPASAAVLRFLARRLAADPIAIVAAGRDSGPIAPGALPELRIEPLPPAASAAVLAARAHGLSSGARRRVLEQARGNPLALVELARVTEGDGYLRTAAHADELPLTARLEAAFVSRADGLPALTRMALLVAALAPTASISEVLDAAGIAAHEPVAPEVLDPAQHIGLIDVHEQQPEFSHPLVRSGLVASVTASQRRAAHAALAVALSDPARRLHHLAQATIGHDDRLADELDDAAELAAQRSSPVAAASLLTQAATLTSPGPARWRRMLRAARIDYELGEADAARELLSRLADAELDRPGHARLRLLTLALDGRDGDDPTPVRELIGLAELAVADGDADGALELLEFASRLMVWQPSWAGVGPALVAVARRVPASDSDPRVTTIIAQTMPAEAHCELLERLDRLDDAALADPAAQQRIGFTAVNLGEYERGAALLDRAQQRLRADARLAPLATVLTYRAIAAFSGGRWRLALQDLDEAERLADDTVQESWLNIVHYVRAGILGMQGDDERHRRTIDELAAKFERESGSHRDNHLTFMVGIADAMRGRHDEAIATLGTLFDPDSPMFEVRTCFDALFYLADAASAKGRPEVVRDAIAVLERAVSAPFPPALQSAIDYARALGGDEAGRTGRFEAALAGPAASRPFDRARVQLAYGEWLRRANHRTEARERLRDARLVFEKLGNEPFAARARAELRAAGEAVPRRRGADWDRLAPQELQIARLVSQGLSNKQIGEQLFLSHRTIGAHLYRIFPKLGVTTRAQLAAALREREDDG